MDIIELLKITAIHHSFWLPSVSIMFIPVYFFARYLPEIKRKKPNFLIVFFLGWFLIGMSSSIFGKKHFENYMMSFGFLSLAISTTIVTVLTKSKSPIMNVEETSNEKLD